MKNERLDHWIQAKRYIGFGDETKELECQKCAGRIVQLKHDKYGSYYDVFVSEETDDCFCENCKKS